ncbi:unnamed protein product [Toxocara canis]|uniref:GATOR2 complex protein WDR24 n=1 Tax=Toxocara canis TaxID=6265 RepID=A0A183UU46_TOXCA|nr:unnamed protein product [Toxocara canis]
MKNARRNIRIDLQEQVDALSSNRDNTRLVAAGSKGLMKIFSTENSTLSVVADLRPVRTRKLNLMYSASHVAWSPVVDNLVATTSTNGAVVLWDVEKGALERIYKAHNRSATKVCFHRIDRNTFISGAKDAIVAQYDLRSPTFAQKFISGSFDPIRDIQFGLHFEQMDIFVSADDGGSVRFWDLRRNDRPLKQFVAHHGPASVALNPSYDDRNLIATAGRDKFIRVDLEMVGLVRWGHKFGNIFSRIDNARRSRSMEAATQISDMIWNPEVDDSFVTAAKDGLIVMHYFENAHYPLAYVNDIAVDVSPSGEILKLKNEALTDKEKLEKGEAVPPRRRKYDPFQSWTHSSLIRCVPRAAQKALCPDNFIRLAQNYKLSGGELEVLCDYNSQVAESIGSCQVAHTWRMLSLLCSLSPFFDPSSSKPGESEEVVTRSRFSSSRSSGGAMRNADGSDEVMGCLFATCVPPTLSETADFYFGDAELNTAGLASDLLDVNIRLDSSPFLRMEAFLPRPCDELETLEETRSMSSEEASSSSFSSTADESDTSMEQYCSRIGGLSVSVDAICPPPWDPLPMIQSMFMQYAEVGDVQTCVSILLVLGEKTVDLVDISVQKLWFLDYLEMLECYELWNTCAEVIKLCWIPSVSALSRESTFLRLVCQKCKAVSTNVSPICKNAMPVRGVWGWCRECRHGGHPEHLAQWFSTDSHCPTGCGHLCVPGRRK